jgi:YVTN family beta-propeller protein
MAGVGALLLAAAVVAGVLIVTGSGGEARTGTPVAARSEAPPTTTSTLPATTTTTAPPSTTRTLHLDRTITGPITPKSVVASGRGLVFAQNMIYQHSVTVYDSNFNLVTTIPDSVDLSTLGHPEHPGVVKGGPVEAAFAPNGHDVYVSNYSMYGPGFPHPGDDTCSPSEHRDSSYVYRIDVQKLAIDAAIPVGSTPKFLAVTPDGRYLIVSNWCSYDISVVDPATNQEVKRIPVGAYPRGIAVDPTSTTAYIAVMGSRDIAKLDLATLTLTYIRNVGQAPRHLVMDPAGQFLYATLNGDGQVIKIDLATDTVVARVATGQAPRSMTIAPDGRSLYVVNYDSSDVAKLDASDMHILQTVRTDTHPIGITYDATTNRVWVACYSGAIMVFDDA